MQRVPSQSTAGSAFSPIEAARQLAPQICAAAERIESERRLPADVVDAIKAAGLFRLCVPRSIGGAEVDVATMVGSIETVAQADGSAGWCVMIGATSGLVSAYLSEPVAREIYADPDGVSGGVLAPLGKATVVDGGYRVSGRWAFASGCQHCSWLMGGSVVLDGAPRVLANGTTESRMMLFPVSQAEIIDTWTVSGLRGTGSQDIAVHDLFVAHDHSASLINDRPREGGTLYVFPVFGLLALGIAGVALGIGRRAIDELTGVAASKTPSGSRRRLADRPLVQMQVAQSEATLRAARAFLYEAVAEVWAAASTQGAISLDHRALLRLSATHATVSAAQVVDAMYHAGGGTSIYACNPLQRCFRDVHVATQHMMVGLPTYEVAGRVLLGIDTDTSML